MIRRALKILDGGMGHSLANQVLVSGFSFAVGIIAARLLGISEFGLFSLIFMISQMLVVIEGDLLTVPMMTITGSKPRMSKFYYGNLFSIATFTSFVSAVVMMLFLWIYFFSKGEPAPPDLMLAALFFTFTQNLQIISRRVLFARQKYVHGILLEAIRPASVVLLALGAWAYGMAPSVALLLTILGISSLLPILIAAWKYLHIHFDIKMISAILYRHWPMSSWFFLTMLVSIFQEQALWTIVGIEIGDAGIGALRSGQYLLGITHVLVLSLENFLPRTAAEHMRTGKASALKNYLLQQFIVVGGVSLVIILFLDFFAFEVLTFIFGAEYGEYAHLLRLFSIVYLIALIRSMFMQYLRAVEDIKTIFKCFFISSAVAIACIYPLLNQFGLEGAVYCMIIAQSVLLFTMAIAAMQHHAANASATLTEPVEGK